MAHPRNTKYISNTEGSNQSWSITQIIGGQSSLYRKHANISALKSTMDDCTGKKTFII